MTATAVTPTRRVSPAHTPAQTVLLYLLPGAAAFAAYVGLVPLAHQLGLPSAAVLAAVGLLVIAPVQLGLLSGTPPPPAGRTSRHAPRPVAAAPPARMGGVGDGARRHRIPRDGAAETTAPRLGLRRVAGRLDRPGRNRHRLHRHCAHRDRA